MQLQRLVPCLFVVGCPAVEAISAASPPCSVTPSCAGDAWTTWKASDLAAVWANRCEVWTVAVDGSAWRWSDGVWGGIKDPDDVILFDVLGSATGAIWIVGDSATLLRWKDGRLTRVDAGSVDPENYRFRRLWLDDSGRPWIASWVRSVFVVEPDGSNVMELLLPERPGGSGAQFLPSAITGHASDGVSVAGRDGVLGWDGTAWLNQSGAFLDGYRAYGLWVDRTADNLWVGGNDFLAHRADGQWTTEALPDLDGYELWDIEGDSAGHVWVALSGSVAGMGRGQILRWTGGQWTKELGEPDTTFSPRGIHLDDEGILWAAGSGGSVQCRKVSPSQP